ncbi:MAG TPA: hypothetical protein VHJ38_15470 [Nitrososphaeraceae archaeon]|nr:hypothetical protein [Nitrososphaeraceae archaeon]
MGNVACVVFDILSSERSLITLDPYGCCKNTLSIIISSELV